MEKWNTPGAIEETIEEVCAKVKLVTGSGRKPIKPLHQVAVEFENKDGTQFMDEEEIIEMKNHIHFEYEPKFVYRNEKRVSLPETRLRFKGKTNSPELMERTFDQFIRYCIGKAGGNLERSKMSFGFFHEGFHKAEGFWINERTYQTFNGQVLMEELVRITQSKAEVDIDDTFIIHMHVFNNFEGGAGRCRKKMFDEQKKLPAYVVGDGKCLPKAVALAMTFYASKEDAEQRSKWDRMIRLMYRSLNEKLQLAAANEILEKSGLSTEQQVFNIDDLEKIAATYPEYKFEVYSRPAYEKYYQIITEFNFDASKLVTIAFKKIDGVGHYDFIKPSLMHMKATYCHKCKQKTLSTGHNQVCDAKCGKCGFYECDNTQIETIHCEMCNTNFPNEDCYNGHLEYAYRAKKTMCEKRYTCLECGFRVCKDKVSQDEVHECEKRSRCMQCKEMYDATRYHNCCFQPPRKRFKESKMKAQKSYRILCYDVETIVVNSANGPDFSKPQPNHEVNLVCFKMCCNLCVEEGMECDCETGNFHYFEHVDPLEDFVDFLLHNTKLDNAYVIAHNGGRYDHNFVLSRIMTSFGIIPDYVSNGTSLIMANITASVRRTDTHNSLKFRDSFRFIPMPLSKMPKTFGITELKKGYYPYYFNHKENYGKVLNRLPDKLFYDPEHMKPEPRIEFEKWYEDHQNDVFDADMEILVYCQSDVEILTSGLSEYIKICKRLFNNWNPIIYSCTIASYVHHILKFEHFQQGDLGIISENGWPERNNSVFALKTLMWLEKKDGVTIHHKLRGPEKMIKMPNGDCFFVDGYEEKSNTVYEIYGCFYHGCPMCTNPTLEHPNHPGVENKAIYDRTMKREERIKEAEYNVISWWEHEINEMLKKDSEMRDFFKKCRHASHLVPREGMFGGRTQPYQMIVECEEDEEICYDDFNSLYPSVNIMFQYPRGQPIVYKTNFPSIIPGKGVDKKGLYFCSIYAPPAIKITVLPYKIPGFLTFPSCRTCIEKNQKTACNHTKVSDRYLTGVWTHAELNAAIERGYQLLQFHEIWWWPDDKWKTADYFVNYLKSMIQLKHESSGWPKDGMTDEEKLAYINEIAQRDGVTLVMENVKKADNMREMSKLFLNTCWGKLAENPVRTESKLFETLDHVSQSEYMSKQGYEVKGIKDWDDGRTLITRASKTESVKTKEFTSIVIGIYTTSYARLRLLQAMEAVGSENLIYVDTDSVIYKKKISDPCPVKALIGDGLGKLKSEIPKGYQMKKIICMASKVYSYLLKHLETGEEKIVTKFKGVVLNSSTSRTINMKTMEASVREFLDGQTNVISVPERTMRRTKVLGEITTAPFEKRLKPVMDKVRVLPGGKTLPSGYYLNCPLVEDYPYS
ncbi:hypothetical protein CRE_23046 [Caenorhabditis remanei]|uniref:DNA-directed DNA polymerase n=1 Tax=Caenorhabditis remanei TaxID=31234 RepID=E3N9D0_CAERE|nr:hypothetical protein CRE_23046 [Caenorhabditis remanei]